MQPRNEEPTPSYRLAAEVPAGYTPESAGPTEASGSIEGRLLRMLFKAFGNPRVQIILWNGEAVCTSAEPPVANMHIADRATLVRLCADPDVQFGEGYSAGNDRGRRRSRAVDRGTLSRRRRPVGKQCNLAGSANRTCGCIVARRTR